MDDKLYYVESPDEQVLGPMTMMHVLEGVAAGVILESARICEVGAQEWVYLSDVAYTREGESDATSAAAPAEQYFGREEPEVAGSAAEEEPDDLGVMHGSSWQVVEEEHRPEAPAETAAHRGAMWVDETEPRQPVAAHREEPAETTAAMPHEARFEEDAPVAVSRPETFEAPFDEDEGGSPEDPFAGDDERAEDTHVEGKRRPRWLIPALAVLAVPAFVGAWMFTGRPLPFLAQDEPAPAPASQISPLQEARELLVAGQAAEAQLRYEAILETDPGNAVAMHGRGMAAMGAGDLPTAVQSLEQACSSESNRPVWTADLARALHASGRLDSALDRINGYLAEHPEDREHQVARLDWLTEADRSSEAAEIYAGLAKENPVNAYYQYLAGLALADETAAETYLRRSIELDPENGDAHAALGRLLAARGDTAGARESLQLALERRPATAEDNALLASLDQAEAAAVPDPPVPAPKPKPTVTAAAKKDAKKDEPQKTETAKAPAPPPSAPEPKEVAEVTKPKPKAAPAPDFSRFASRIRDELNRERFESARGVVEEARKATGSGRTARNNAGLWDGIIAFEEGRFDDALARFQALDSQADYSVSGFGSGAPANWIARVWFAKGDVRKAVAALDGVGPADPDEYAVARLWEGLALATLGMDDLAARTWERIPTDVGKRVRSTGRGAVKTAELLTGAISEKDYRTAVSPVTGYGNDMYFFLAYAAHRKADEQAARENFARAVEESAGREFPYHLAQAQVTGEGILGK